MAGALPLIAASVQLYAASSTGNGAAATALGAPTITDAAGAFTIPSTNTCPYSLSVLYVVARGGRAGAAGATNAGTVLLAALGPCNSVPANANFVVNETTSVASAFAMAQFLSSGGNLGATATNFSGIGLAAATAANLVNLTTGNAPGANFPANSVAPVARLNALANAMNACIVASASGCAPLYAATAVGGSLPANTLDAVMNIAKHPGGNVGALFALTAASSAYAPTLSAAPSDWTMFVTYAGGGMNGPAGVGIDSAGNVHVANYFDSASYFSNTGAPAFPNGIPGNNLHESFGLAIDQSDNTWITNEQTPSSVNAGLGSVTVLNSAGQTVAGPSGYAMGGLNFPLSIAIDSSATSWIVDYGNSHLTLLDQSGNPRSGTTGYTTPQFAFPVAIAVDSHCYGFVANQGGNTVTRVTPDGSNFSSFVTGSGPSGVAVDSADNVWVANYYGNTVGLLSSAGQIVSSGYTGGGISQPQGVAIDGANNAWIANYRGSSLTELAGAASTLPGTVLSPASGYGSDAGLLEAFGIAIDASGDVWVTNFGSNTLTEFVGLAVPVRTPLLGAVAIP